MEPRANFQQASDEAVNFRPSFGWTRDTRENLQEGSLAGTIPPDEAQHLALFDFQ